MNGWQQGCVWRALPARFGRWHTVYMRLHRWARSGLLERVWRRWTARSSSCISTARGCRTTGAQAIGRSCGGWTTKLHIVAVDEYTPLILSLTPG